MTSSAPRRVSWELIGLLAVAAMFLVGGLRWLLSAGARGEIRAPEHLTLDVAAGLPSGTTPEGEPYIGSPSAPLTVEVVGDFQCPHCRRFAQGAGDEILRDYVAPGKVRLVWIGVGFDGAESAASAAAGLCAAAQGLFWPMHDWLFHNQSSVLNSGAFSRPRLEQMAAGAGLDAARFGRCLDDPATAAKVEANDDFARGRSVFQTPAFVIGDRLVEGVDIPGLRAAIDAALAE